MLKKRLGSVGESLAAQHLQNKGYRILQKNFSCRFGEIDLVALEGDDVVMVEIKTRRGRTFGRPEEAVTPFKIKRLQRAGHLFKQRHSKLPDSLRIDTVAVTLSSPGKSARIEIFRNVTG